MTRWFSSPSDGARPSRTPAELARPGIGSHRAWERGMPSPAVPSASATCETGGPVRPRAAGGTRPAPGTRGGARAAGAGVGGEARPGNEWAGGRGGAVGHRHSLRKTRYSRVKGAARSSLLKPLIIPLTSRRHTATSSHAAPTDKEKTPRLRTTETGPESGEGNGLRGHPTPTPRPAHAARRRTPPGLRVLSSQPLLPGPPSRGSPLALRLGHVAGG